MIFDVQRFATDYRRDPQEITYRGRRRISGNYGRVYLLGDDDSGVSATINDDMLVFEITAFSAKVTAEREDVWIGISKDSKAVGYSGEGEITIHQVYDRGYKYMMDKWQTGHDPRFVIVGVLSDPDTVQNGEERVKFVNCWINELEIMNWEKGSIVQKTLPFGFTPSDIVYEDIISLESES